MVVTALLTNVGEHHLRSNQARDVMQVRRAELELVTSGRPATASAIAQELERPVDVVTEFIRHVRGEELGPDQKERDLIARAFDEHTGAETRA